jgi:hypothetical protein
MVQKVVIELVCSISIVNAWYIHRKWGTKKHDFLKFRVLIIMELLKDGPIETDLSSKKQKHLLEEFSEKPRTVMGELRAASQMWPASDFNPARRAFFFKKIHC